MPYPMSLVQLEHVSRTRGRHRGSRRSRERAFSPGRPDYSPGRGEAPPAPGLGIDGAHGGGGRDSPLPTDRIVEAMRERFEGSNLGRARRGKRSDMDQ